MKNSPQTIGALQAIGLVIYFALIANVMHIVSGMDPERSLGPVLGPSLFLLIFSTSVLICGTLALGYPIKLFFTENRRSDAMHIVGWTIGWLIGFALLLVVYLFAYGPLLK